MVRRENYKSSTSQSNRNSHIPLIAVPVPRSHLYYLVVFSVSIRDNIFMAEWLSKYYIYRKFIIAASLSVSSHSARQGWQASVFQPSNKCQVICREHHIRYIGYVATLNRIYLQKNKQGTQFTVSRTFSVVNWEGCINLSIDT